jgi:hypothetical protein
MAQIEFFATEKDEYNLFLELSKDKQLKYSFIVNERLKEWQSFSDIILPPYENSLQLSIWKDNIGDLKWITKEPDINRSKHALLVKSLFTKLQWKKIKETGNVNRLLDDENSPILYYKRGTINIYRLPSYIIAPQTNINLPGDEFRKWYNRIYSLIRRNSQLVFSLNKNELNLKNDMDFLNNIYALPEALEQIKTHKNNFAISIKNN